MMKKWELSKEQAIEEHRKMWRWIYDTVKNRIETGNYKKDGMFKPEYIDAILLKREYISKFYPYYEPLSNDCFLCQYTDYIAYYESDTCEKLCPLKWTDGSCMCYGSYKSEYRVVLNMTMEISKTGNIPKDYLEIIKKIRDLPVKENTND